MRSDEKYSRCNACVMNRLNRVRETFAIRINRRFLRKNTIRLENQNEQQHAAK